VTLTCHQVSQTKGGFDDVCRGTDLQCTGESGSYFGLGSVGCNRLKIWGTNGAGRGSALSKAAHY
jgi:hypothetical protein